MNKKKAWLFTFFVFIQLVPHSQPHDIKNLVFEGGGIRGIAYCGALQVLEEKGISQHIIKVAGTSAGALTALCFSLGYTGNEITNILYDLRFKKFNDGLFILAPIRLSRFFGWYKGKKIASWIESLIAVKTGDGNITFEKLYQLGYKDLYITATSLNKEKALTLSRLTYPKMRVKDAVRASLSIPFYFEPLCIDKDGYSVYHPKKNTDYDMLIDGMLLQSLPVRIFDSVVQEGDKTRSFINSQTISIRLETEKQETDEEGLYKPINSFKSFTTHFFKLVNTNTYKNTIQPEDKRRIVTIHDSHIDPKIKKIKPTQIALLINNGRTALEKFLMKNNTENAAK